MKSRTTLAGTLLLILVSINAAYAQFGRVRGRGATLDTISRGDGRLEIGRETRALDRVRVILRRNGNAELTFYRDSVSYPIEGRWSRDRTNVVNLQITRRANVPATGSGRIFLDRDDSVERVEIRGEERGERLQVSFWSGRVPPQAPSLRRGGSSTRAGAEGGISSTGELNRTSRGEGRLEIGNDTTRTLDRASLLLRRGGRAEVRLYRGSTPYVFTGQWSGDPSREVDLQLTQRNNEPLRASGRAILRRNGDLERLQISGQEGREQVRVSFRAEGSRGNGNPFGYIRDADERRQRAP
jgi:hypothetical protein